MITLLFVKEWHIHESPVGHASDWLMYTILKSDVSGHSSKLILLFRKMGGCIQLRGRLLIDNWHPNDTIFHWNIHNLQHVNSKRYKRVLLWTPFMLFRINFPYKDTFGTRRSIVDFPNSHNAIPQQWRPRATTNLNFGILKWNQLGCQIRAMNETCL